MKTSVCVAIWAIIYCLIFYILEQRAISAWPPGGSFVQSDVFQTTKGPIKLPILYFEGSVVGVFYLVEPEAAQELLPKELEPLLLPFFNKAISGIFMFDYKNTTIGPYGEMGLAIQARRKGSGATLIGYLYDMFAHVYKIPWMLNFFSSEDTGLYVVTLPVETEGAWAGGREIWGYNKYVTKFQSDFSKPEEMAFTLDSEFSFKMTRSSFSPSIAGLPFLTYTKLGGKLIRTIIEVGHKAEYGFKDIELNIFGTGKTADAMKRLGLGELAPLLAFRTDNLRSHLPRGTILSQGYSPVSAQFTNN